MKSRKLYWGDDILLDPENHPAGTRLILSRKSDSVDPYEARVVEWAPSGERVLLRRPGGREYWCECFHYSPVVIEVLNKPEPYLKDGVEGGGYYWFKSDFGAGRSIVQLCKGGWYPINEIGPVEFSELVRRGWHLDEAVEGGITTSTVKREGQHNER